MPVVESTDVAETKTEAPPDGEAPPDAQIKVTPFSEQELEKLLGQRVKGGMGYSFGQFANMFLVTSHIDYGMGIGLMTPSKEIAKKNLQSPFPIFYRPTLREFLDAIALQTSSSWKYDPTNQYVKSDVKRDIKATDLAIFEFVGIERVKPFEVTLAEGWKSNDKGNWLMLIPPSFPVGMDIYEMGSYSSDDSDAEQELFTKVRAEVALEWAQRVHKQATAEDMQAAKVGPYDALYFEALVPSQLKKDMRWRQWVFWVDAKCYFIVSTILPELDDDIFPDVEKMLASFRLRTK